MFGLSFATFRERWPLFTGAILTVAMGVALVQSALLVLAATGKPQIPPGLSRPDQQKIVDGYAGAATLMGMTVPLSAFLAVFIVSSTFAFTVAQRRRDLALLRVLGGARRQLRRLLLSEAVLLGVIGTAIGVPLGVVATEAQAWLLVEVGFLPATFTAPFGAWVLQPSIFVGLGIAVAGVLAASRRAAKVRPLDALRDTGSAARVMTASRWLYGIAFLLISAAFVALAPLGGLVGAMGMAMAVSMTGSVALSALSPLVVPFVGRGFGLLLRGTTLGGLAEANLRDGVRRSASTAAPLIVLVALLLGLSGTLGTLALATGEQMGKLVKGDLVAVASGAQAERIAFVPGVAAVSHQSTVPITVTAAVQEDPEERPRNQTYESRIVAVDTSAYQQTHQLRPRAGSLAELHGATIAVGPGLSGDGLALGSTVTAAVAGQSLALRIVAVMPETLESGDSFLVPREIIPAGVLAEAPTESVVQLAPGADAAAVREGIRAVGATEVLTVREWATALADAQQAGNVSILAVLMGLSGLYALVAVINAQVIAGSERRGEFAVARVTGLKRVQVVWVALIESWAVTVIGVFLGMVVALGTLAGMAAGTASAVGTPVVDIPWGLLGVVTAGAFVVIGITSAATTYSATKERPVTLVTARE